MIKTTERSQTQSDREAVPRQAVTNITGQRVNLREAFRQLNTIIPNGMQVSQDKGPQAGNKLASRPKSAMRAVRMFSCSASRARVHDDW
eukprot:7474183-Heterocapsa_arctica.AAC.1